MNPIFTEAGITDFNHAAALCAPGSPDPDTCPTGRLAIVVDDLVVTAPAVFADTFERDAISISGGFTLDEAKSLAEAMRTGTRALRPVLLEPLPLADLTG